MVDLKNLHGIALSLNAIPSTDNHLNLYIHGIIPGYINSGSRNDYYDYSYNLNTFFHKKLKNYMRIP